MAKDKWLSDRIMVDLAAVRQQLLARPRVTILLLLLLLFVKRAEKFPSNENRQEGDYIT